jgi:uncharacterized protein
MDFPSSEYIKLISVRFYAELNDFLRPAQRQRELEFPIKGQMTVKGVIESLGVPHSAVDLVVVNGKPAGFSYVLKKGDYVSVYPEFEAFDISGISKNRKKSLRSSRFILDAHLGKLAKKLRLLGFDSLFAREISDDEIIDQAHAERRIILTRDRDLLKSEKVDHGYYIRATDTDGQLKEIIVKFDLWSQFDPFARCLICNGELEKADISEVRGQINQETASIFSEFFRCSSCKKIYWEGSHYESMKGYIENLR